MQVEQSHCVCHRGPAPADLLRNFFLTHSEFLGEARVTLRFFDRVKICALQVFDQREFQHIAIISSVHGMPIWLPTIRNSWKSQATPSSVIGFATLRRGMSGA